MQTAKIIKFDHATRILRKASSYADSVDLFLEEQDQAIPLLLKALQYAKNDERKKKIMLLLGSFAKEEVARPLYKILKDSSQDEDIRLLASGQLCTIFRSLRTPEPLIDNLLEDIENPDPEIRTFAASALGWKGNHRAAIPLISLLYDPDPYVQQSAVSALSNMGDDRIFNLFTDRLEHGSIEQKKSILFNLWLFESRKKEVAKIYRRYLRHKNPELRMDSLVLMETVSEPSECIEIYGRCLQDHDSRIRALALKYLSEVPRKDLAGLKKTFEKLLSDPDTEVRREAFKILRLCRA